MSKLYVANTSKQINEFIYQVAESSRPFVKRILPGEQVMVHDGARIDIDSIINHHGQYGMRSIADVNPAVYVGLIYSIDTPIKSDKIAAVVEYNDVALQAMGEQIRSEGIAALSETLDQSAASTGAQVNELEVEVTEEGKPGAPGTLMKETQTIVKEGMPAKPSRSHKRKN